MSRATEFFRKKYRDWGDFLFLNSTNEKDVCSLCELSRWSLRHYREGNAYPSPERVKLVELVRKGRMPWPEWYGFTISPEGIYPPNEYRQYTSPEDIRSRWLSVQTVADLKREIRQLKEKLADTDNAAMDDPEVAKMALWMVLERGLQTIDLPQWVIDDVRQRSGTFTPARYR